MSTANYIEQYFSETKAIVDGLCRDTIENMIGILEQVRQAKGRVFILGIGGSGANASHLVNDLRKIAGMETYTPADNFSEFSARVNDEGWDSSFIEWLKVSRLREEDALFVLSVGGGSAETSQNIVRAVDYAREAGAKILGIVSRDGGHTARMGDAVVLIPVVADERVTPHAEGFQGIVWHLVVNALAVPSS